MSSEIAKRDQNDVPVLTGITDDAFQEIRMLRVNPVTGRLLTTGTVSGASGFQSPLTGSVDGSNQTFTWTTAPNAICIDGLVYQQTQQDGTVIWTGTTSTVLSIAPNFSVFAVA